MPITFTRDTAEETTRTIPIAYGGQEARVTIWPDKVTRRMAKEAERLATEGGDPSDDMYIALTNFVCRWDIYGEMFEEKERPATNGRGEPLYERDERGDLVPRIETYYEPVLDAEGNPKIGLVPITVEGINRLPVPFVGKMYLDIMQALRPGESGNAPGAGLVRRD